ncbi:TauD/TfdA family dioxygenase [Reyranella sp. CPCC 100927]|uniref:TauD/TfdA dioxygenase family protein n=1 Tax=Reyranella sp. CPCC 100927 TaxID=2599616 RepID=UPI0011B817F1|nr:TauD/TfdA family dioxygenase [Reyranella sp. CPCC 100927]TWT10824.1 taurine dioxygenase [Reyranella sp. CPCC 100927]
MTQQARRNFQYLDVRPIAGALGAELHGIDLSQDLDDDMIAEVRQAWLDHLVVFFRDQTLTPAQQVAFARRLGEPMEYPQLKGLPDQPLITPVMKLEHERTNFGGVWHSDTTYLERPPMASMLYAKEIPPQGGDTEFANQYLAYETLSAGMRHVLDGLTGISSSLKADASKTREDRLKAAGEELKTLIAEHPIVRTHPETGRKALFLNTGHTTQFKGWTEKESQPLLDFLFQHQVRPEFTCRFRWQPGSLALWDNRCAMHNPINDYHGYRRILHRITLAGDRPA